MFNEDQNKKVNSIYGLDTYGWKQRIFVDFTSRNDWASTLPIKNNSYFYPSVNTSFILSQLSNLPTQISFAKLPLSFAQGGNDPRAYYTSKYYGAVIFPDQAQ